MGLAICSDVGLFELKAAIISLTLIKQLIAPQIHPNKTRTMWHTFLFLVKDYLYIRSYISTGRIKARAVQANDPIKLIKSPNFGTIVAPIADRSTINVRKNRRLVGR